MRQLHCLNKHIFVQKFAISALIKQPDLLRDVSKLLFVVIDSIA